MVVPGQGDVFGVDHLHFEVSDVIGSHVSDDDHHSRHHGFFFPAWLVRTQASHFDFVGHEEELLLAGQAALQADSKLLGQLA